MTTERDMDMAASTFSNNEPVIKSLESIAVRGPIYTLPNEILSQILRCLDAPRDLSQSVLDEPCLKLTHSDIVNLKAASSVSKAWRQAAFPMLFKHLRFIIRVPRMGAHEVPMEDQLNPFLDFAKCNSLCTIIESFTLIVEHQEPHLGRTHPSNRAASFSQFWSTIFEVLDPAELLIVAPVEALAELTACGNVRQSDAWSFDCPYQYLQLIQPKKSTKSRALGSSISANKSIRAQEQAKGSPESADAASGSTSPGEVDGLQPERYSLLRCRPWSKLLLNEGSFIKAYATYEWWQRVPASILPCLVGSDDEEALISPTIRDFSYIAIFPFMNHFQHIVRNLPRLDRLYTQFVPRNEILQDRKKMSNVEATDLWTERNGCYSVLMGELFNAPPEDNYRYLKTFESGDAADRDAWNMAVEYVRQVGKGWKVVSDGVFVREPVPTDGTPVEGDEDQHNILTQGALARWAFNGTAELPVSAYTMYARARDNNNVVPNGNN